MDTRDLSQLSLSNALLNDDGRENTNEDIAGVKVQVVAHHKDYKQEDLIPLTTEERYKVLYSRLHRFPHRAWPKYTLRPSINRIAFTKALPDFRTEQLLWPVRFELHYAAFWSLAGGTQGILLPICCEYADNHRTTHRRGCK